MKLLFCFLLSVAALIAGEHPPAQVVWDQLDVKRWKLGPYHQEFEVTDVARRANGERSSKHQVVDDANGAQWRQKDVSGSGNTVYIFDGQDLYRMEEGGSEYTRIKRKSEGPPLPQPYDVSNLDWSKAATPEQRPCGFAELNHTCVVLRVPVKATSKVDEPGKVYHRLPGVRILVLDTETGLLVVSRNAQTVQTLNGSYESDISYTLRRMNWGKPVDSALFRLPSDLKEVKDLSFWNAARLKKQLVGQPAPELAVVDLQGKRITLSELKGRIVLLDFWTTWCSPCRADAPALDKLHQRYGDRNLTIIGVSVSEERATVEKFLTEYPHPYPVVLTTENEFPRPFQIGVFPTYVIIDRDGSVAGAVEGDQGFGDLQKLLKKAGLETEEPSGAR